MTAPGAPGTAADGYRVEIPRPRPRRETADPREPGARREVSPR